MDLAVYKQLEDDLRESIKASKSGYESKITQDVKNNPKNFYSYVSRKEPSNIAAIVDNGNTMTDDKDIAEALNAFFASTFTQEDLNSIPRLDDPDSTKILDIDIDKDSVLKKLQNLKESKAPGPDGLYPRILKEVCNEIALPLAQIFRKSLDEGTVVGDWKMANVTPLHKKGKADMVENYRPISLTSVPCKILESIIKDKLTEHLQSQNLLHSTQHGFMSGRSCLTNLLEYLEHITMIDCYLDNQKPVGIIA